MATKQDEHNWDLHLPLVMLAYRTSVQESTGCTPFELVYGRDARLPADVMYGLPPQTSPTEANQYALDLRLRMEKAYRQVREHMGLQHQRQKELYNKSSNGDPFKVGDMVWLHCPAVPRGKSPKLHCFWQGPYRIHKVVSDVLYNISLRDRPRKHQVVHFVCTYLQTCRRDSRTQLKPFHQMVLTSLLTQSLMALIMAPSYQLCLEI